MGRRDTARLIKWYHDMLFMKPLSQKQAKQLADIYINTQIKKEK